MTIGRLFEKRKRVGPTLLSSVSRNFEGSVENAFYTKKCRLFCFLILVGKSGEEWGRVGKSGEGWGRVGKSGQDPLDTRLLLYKSTTHFLSDQYSPDSLSHHNRTSPSILV